MRLGRIRAVRYVLRSLRARSALRSPRTSLPSRGPRAAPPSQEPSALRLRKSLPRSPSASGSDIALQALAPATRSRHLLRLRLLPPRPPRAPRAPRVLNHFSYSASWPCYGRSRASRAISHHSFSASWPSFGKTRASRAISHHILTNPTFMIV